MNLDGKKVVPAGVLVVAEDDRYLCHVPYEKFGAVLASRGAKLQSTCNSATDIVVLGSTAREANYEETAKGKAHREELAKVSSLAG